MLPMLAQGVALVPGPRAEWRSGLRRSPPRASSGRDASEELPGSAAQRRAGAGTDVQDGRADISQLDENKRKTTKHKHEQLKTLRASCTGRGGV